MYAVVVMLLIVYRSLFAQVLLDIVCQHEKISRFAAEAVLAGLYTTKQ